MITHYHNDESNAESYFHPTRYRKLVLQTLHDHLLIIWNKTSCSLNQFLSRGKDHLNWIQLRTIWGKVYAECACSSQGKLNTSCVMNRMIIYKQNKSRCCPSLHKEKRCRPIQYYYQKILEVVFYFPTCDFVVYILYIDASINTQWDYFVKLVRANDLVVALNIACMCPYRVSPKTVPFILLLCCETCVVIPLGI